MIIPIQTKITKYVIAMISICSTRASMPDQLFAAYSALTEPCFIFVNRPSLGRILATKFVSRPKINTILLKMIQKCKKSLPAVYSVSQKFCPKFTMPGGAVNFGQKLSRNSIKKVRGGRNEIAFFLFLYKRKPPHCAGASSWIADKTIGD